MQPTIHVLSEETINQIAAGEVVESPSSVVKELIENAFDAKAQSITIEIVGGGLKLIRVSDDGKGMHEMDAELAIKRHATSKIKKAQDLFHLHTMGFRGEALASIAAISKMVLFTAEENCSGIQLEIEKGGIVKKMPCARTRGTTVEVHSLFNNVPARKKFQKSVPAISAEIFRTVTIMALSHPTIGFTLISNRRKTFEVPKGKDCFLEQLKIRASQVLGDEFIQHAFWLNFNEGSLHFSGMIGSPIMTRANKTNQYLFLNQRLIQCGCIEDAVKKGYATRLEERRHPFFLLHLDMPSDLVDVNVHPQKIHVRLRDEVLIRAKVQEAVESALSESKQSKNFQISSHDFAHSKPMQSLENPYEKVTLSFQENIPIQNFSLEFEKYQFMGIIGHFLFLEGNSVEKDYDGVVIVDLEAARAGVIFDQFLANPTKSLEQQVLLIPFSIILTPIESTMILSHLKSIERMGFRLKPVAKDTFMVEAMPSFMEQKQVQKMIAEMALSLQSFIGKMDFESERQKKLALIASCYAKKKEVFFEEEALQIFEKLKETKSPLFCPRGRLTMVHVSRDEIQSLFTTHKKIATISS